ncbi:GNAT family N-acetyltransferase [Arcobacter sp. CECT 8983]|uniref:GNAT family N-acetyltransferase n=1 Tax=Arcobacter sp. CECT 8983 TaxID=2044508 RepID=UPI00100BB6FB|nr:GNAT family N-acetyltransferase [Arcobacter sp. CECT 8983]RXJ89302.1 GNAT family N-acetyltransferase [Arcobacter sp. CECT 8983]
MNSLGYEGTESFIKRRISELLNHKDEVLLVAEKENKILGIISLHFIPQLALEKDFCRISYFCISNTARSQGIGAILEAKAVELATNRGCDRMEVHCNERRTEAHRFYYRQGYIDSPKYLYKSLIENKTH